MSEEWILGAEFLVSVLKELMTLSIMIIVYGKQTLIFINSSSCFRFIRDECVCSLILLWLPPCLHSVRLPVEHVSVLGPLFRKWCQHTPAEGAERGHAAVCQYDVREHVFLCPSLSLI